MYAVVRFPRLKWGRPLGVVWVVMVMLRCLCWTLTGSVGLYARSRVPDRVGFEGHKELPSPLGIIFLNLLLLYKAESGAPLYYHCDNFTRACVTRFIGVVLQNSEIGRIPVATDRAPWGGIFVSSVCTYVRVSGARLWGSQSRAGCFRLLPNFSVHKSSSIAR